MRRKKLLAVVALIIGSTVPVFADRLNEDRKDGSFGVRAMRFEAADSDEANWNGGVQLRFNLSSAFSLEGSADYRRDDYGPVKVHTYPVQASLLLHLMDATVSPFLLGGVGWYFTTVKGPNVPDQTDDRFGLHAGAGLQVMTGEAWSVDGTYRYVWTEDFQSRDAALQNKEFSDSGGMVTLALNYHY